jgi:hypothetical protein
MDQIKMQVIVMEACSLHGRDEKKKTQVSVMVSDV